MTVQELIEELKKMPQDMSVWYKHEESGDHILLEGEVEVLNIVFLNEKLVSIS